MTAMDEQREILRDAESLHERINANVLAECADICGAIATTSDPHGVRGTAEDCAEALRLRLTKDEAVRRLREHGSMRFGEEDAIPNSGVTD